MVFMYTINNKLKTLYQLYYYRKIEFKNYFVQCQNSEHLSVYTSRKVFCRLLRNKN